MNKSLKQHANEIQNLLVNRDFEEERVERMRKEISVLEDCLEKSVSAAQLRADEFDRFFFVFHCSFFFCFFFFILFFSSLPLSEKELREISVLEDCLRSQFLLRSG